MPAPLDPLAPSFQEPAPVPDDAVRWQHVCALFEAALELPEDRRTAFLQATTGTDAVLLAEVEALLAADAESDMPSNGFLDTPAGQVGPMVESVVAEKAILHDPAGPARPGALAWSDEALPGDTHDRERVSGSIGDSEDIGDPGSIGEGVARRGTRLGPWRLVREIGHGGMGTVWLAERADGAFEQRVAIKRVRAALLSEALRQRFAHEQALLARLDHPHIARFIDGGVTEEGVPYLVMEYVPGASLLDHCAERGLGVHERLALFLQVCEAVQYAHRHLVIHRDLKPSNILVTPSGGSAGAPSVKLLDFGIGKLQHADGDLALTHTGARPFTPQYAAPEQVRHQTITTATDVYGLGVLLFELLTGERPFTAPTGSIHEIERAVLEDIPPPPSTVLRHRGADAAARTGYADRARAARAIAGDLDAIVRKALAKMPERRYRSAEALARDLRRHLEAKPVQARRGAFGYRLRRNLYRHRWAVASITTIITLLALGIVAVATQAHRVSVERDKAVASAQFLSHLFNTGDIDLTGNVGTPDGAEISARALLDRAVHRIDRELADQPETRAAMQLTVGRVYQGLGLYDDANALLRDALSTRRQLFGTAHSQVAEVELALGGLLADRSRYDEAEQLHRRALRFYETTRQEEDPRRAEALYELGRTLTLRGHFGDAELLLRRALRHQEQRTDLPPETLGHTLAGLADVLYRQGLLPESEHYYRQALSHYRPALGPLHIRTATAVNELGVVIKNQGRYADAEPYYRDALDAFAQIYGPANPRRAYALANLGVLLKDRGIVEGDARYFDEATPFLEEAHAMHRALYGDTHLRVGHSRGHLGMLALARGRLFEAQQLFEEALALHDAARIPAEHTAWAYPLTGLGETLIALGRPAEAVPLLREALAIREAATGQHWRIAEAQGALGEALLALGRTAEAEPLITASHARVESGTGETMRLRIKAERRIAALHAALGGSEAEQESETEQEDA